MNIVVVLAGGMGARMGQDIPKQFIHVNNIPVIIYTLRALQAHEDIDRIEVACIEGWAPVLLGYAQQFNITKLVGVASGGATRYESTRRGIEALGEVSDEDVILIHDAVRPLVTAASLSDVIRVCQENENSISVLGCGDTMYVRSTVGYTSEVVDRDRLVRGQTPEAMSGRRMREMYAAADVRGIHLDSISAMQNALGWDIHFAEGAERNIKLTRTEDIELFKAFLQTEKDEWLK